MADLNAGSWSMGSTGLTGSRRVPRVSEFADLLRPRPVVLEGDRRRAARAASVGDFREMARRRVPRAVFDYVEGGAESERSLARAREDLDSLHFVARVLRGVSRVDTHTTILGRPSALPIVFAPTGFTRVLHQDGELAVARAAGAAGVPYALSTMGTCSVEEVAEVIPGCRRWFQLYLWSDRGRSRELVDRAAAAGYEALVLTVDTPVAGRRLRDARNGMTLPPSLGLRTFVDGARHPHWWINLLTTRPLTFASLNSWQGTVAELAATLFDPGVDFEDLAWLREQWAGKLVVKGVQSPDDAARIASAGADAIVLSNHGGRQLDRSATPIRQLPSVLGRLSGRCEVFVDGGFTSGADVVAALALGANGVLVGRAYLYGLMAAGELGVRRVADLLGEEIATAMTLLGARSVEELTPDLVRLVPEREAAATHRRWADLSGTGLPVPSR
jgi:L-lactate dehydrogenase (cytochrome)